MGFRSGATKWRYMECASRRVLVAKPGFKPQKPHDSYGEMTTAIQSYLSCCFEVEVEAPAAERLRRGGFPSSPGTGEIRFRLCRQS